MSLFFIALLYLSTGVVRAEQGVVLTGPEPRQPVELERTGPSLLDPNALPNATRSNVAIVGREHEKRPDKSTRRQRREASLTLVGQLTNLAMTLFMATLVWRYYRRRMFPPSCRYQTFGPRFWTGSVDNCVLWPIGFLTFALKDVAMPSALFAVVIVIQNLAWLVYAVVMHAKYGQTYGKMVCKVKVVDHRTEGPLTFNQALIREGIPMILSLGIIGYEISLILSGKLSQKQVAAGDVAAHELFWLLAALPLLWYFAEVATMLTNRKSRALHDFIAGTVVVRTNIG